MKSWSMRALGGIATLTALCTSVGSATAQQTAPRVAAAANAFLATLDTAQRRKVIFAYDDSVQRAHWSNLPVTSSRLAGVNLGELTSAQRAAAMTMLSTVLSRRGYEKIQQIMEADELLRVNERSRAMFGRDLYFISMLGTPSETAPWMLQFGGHHLSLNITIAGAQGVLTPSLTGAQPAHYTANGQTVRPLGQESDKAVTLLQSLDANQRSQAILSFDVRDLVLGPGQDGKTIQPEGLKASAMTERQRALLLDVISEWSGIVHESAAAARMAEIRAGLAETWVAWSGPTDVAVGRNIAAYYRIQGPNLVIEYAPQQLGGDRTLHVHAMYRDPTNDYGRKLSKP